MAAVHVVEERWQSKLGGVYRRRDILALDAKHQRVLRELRRLEANKRCADCGADGTVWAIVNHGIFVCLKCASLHRAVGTHISLPKGCTGTYLWGPDEIEAMRAKGNARAARAFGEVLLPASADENLQKQFLTDKYLSRRFAPRRKGEEDVPDLITLGDQEDLVADGTTTARRHAATRSATHDKPRDTEANSVDFFSDFGL